MSLFNFPFQVLCVSSSNIIRKGVIMWDIRGQGTKYSVAH
jgi:hypothetical protein